MKRNSSKNADNSAKKYSGFTLVELVVVIAVLAILAGVGAVAYKGYIGYAKKSADNELLSAVNTAFAATCEDQGVDRSALGTGGAWLSGTSKTIAGVKSVETVKTGSDLLAFQSAFDGYFEGNTSKELQYYKKNAIAFDGDAHMFKFLEGEELNRVLAEVVKDSFGGNGKFADALSKPLSSVLLFLTRDDLKFLNEDTPLDDRIKTLYTGFKGMLGYNGIDFTLEDFKNQLHDLGLGETATNNELVNYTVMCLAQDTVNGDINTDALVDAVLKGEKINAEDGNFAAFPMRLLRLVGYKNSQYSEGDDDFEKYYNFLFNAPEPTHGLSGRGLLKFQSDGYGQTTLEKSEGWQKYLESGDAENDLNAYIAAMQLFYANSDNVDFNSEDLIKDFAGKLGLLGSQP